MLPPLGPFDTIQQGVARTARRLRQAKAVQEYHRPVAGEPLPPALRTRRRCNVAGLKSYGFHAGSLEPATLLPMLLPTSVLHTARLRLRPFAQDDAGAVFTLQSNPRVLRYWDAPPWTDRDRASAFLAACLKMQEDGSGARFAIETLADTAFIGWCSIFRWNPVFRSLGIGYCFDEPAWGHG